MQQIHRPEMGERPEMGQRPDMAQHAIRGRPCCIPCYPSYKNPKGLHSKHCAAGKEGIPIEVQHSIVSNNHLQNVQNVQDVQNVQNVQNVWNVQNVQNPVEKCAGKCAGNPPNGLKPKRDRTTFRGEHKEIFENVYKDSKYPGNERIQQLALQLNLTFSNVLIWFKNRRAKDRQNPNKENKK